MNRDKLRDSSRLTRIFVLKIAKKFEKSLIGMLELGYKGGLRYTIIIENLLEKIWSLANLFFELVCMRFNNC